MKIPIVFTLMLLVFPAFSQFGKLLDKAKAEVGGVKKRGQYLTRT